MQSSFVYSRDMESVSMTQELRFRMGKLFLVTEAIIISGLHPMARFVIYAPALIQT